MCREKCMNRRFCSFCASHRRQLRETMASATKPLPVPDYPPVAPGFGEPLSVGPVAGATPNGDSSQHRGEFFSTTTAPLRDHEREPPTAGAIDSSGDRRRKGSTASSSNVIDRPRPKPTARTATEPTPAHQSRPSSFYGIDPNADYDGPRRERDALANTWQPNPDPDAREMDRPYHEGQQEYARDVSGGRVAAAELQQRRSSFYGLDSQPVQPSPPATGTSTPSRNDPSPPRTAHASANVRPQTHNSSGSGSYSSHEVPNRPRYSQAPYASSRAASLYGISGSTSNFAMNGTGGGGGGVDSALLPAPAPLLDQSHLQPGAMASLLSHEKTLELYRQNAKKTNDPHVQFEFCAFVMEVVAELEQAAALDKFANATNGANASDEDVGLTEGQRESRRKQKALVTESITLLNKLAQRGHVKSQYFLADCYTQGVGTVKVRALFPPRSHTVCSC